MADPVDDGQNTEEKPNSNTPPTSGDDGQKDYKKLYEQLSKTSQASYTGLQKTLQKIQNDYEALKGTHTTVLEQFGELQKTQTTIQDNLDTVTKERDTFLPELNTLRSFKTRINILHSKFPALVSFEAKGLLPDGKPEELEAKFTAFQSELGGLAKIADEQNRAGSTPPPPGGDDGAPTSAEVFLKQAIQASADGKFDEFDKLFDQYLKASSKK